MSGNVIYRGPIAKEPQTLNLPVNGAHTPGLIVVENGVQFSAAVAADATKKLWILSNRRFMGQDVQTAYVSGETAVAYELLPGEIYQARMAAGTYTLGQALTVDANGRLAAAVAGNTILAYCDQAGTFTVGQLADVRIADKATAA